MKSKGLIITLIVVLSLFTIAISGGLIFLLTRGEDFKFNFNFENANLELIESKEVENTEINKLYINVKSTDIFIKESENDKVLVEYYSNRKNNPKIELLNNTIIVDESEYDVSCVGFCNQRRKIMIFIPESYEGDLEIDTKSGDVKSTTDLSKNNTKINTSSGDVTLSKTGIINVSTSSGDINLDKAKELKATTSSGDIEINTIYDKLSIETSSGDVEIEKINLKDNSNIQTSSGDVEISNNEGLCYIDVTTSSGDQKIKKSDRKSDIVLSIKTNSGDISVN